MRSIALRLVVGVIKLPSVQAAMSCVAPQKARRAWAISRRRYDLLEMTISGDSGAPVDVA